MSKKVCEKFKTIESHTVGEPTRVIIEGFPITKCSSMIQLKEYYAAHYDNLRSSLIAEPRGHKDMVGALLTNAINPSADIGVIYMDATRWINMCGHATIGVATVLVDEHMVEVKEPYTKIVLDTPAGLVKTKVMVENGKALNVTFQNVPSYLENEKIGISLDNGDYVECSVAYSGSFFALVDASKLNLPIKKENIELFVSKGVEIISKINSKFLFKHPDENIRGVENVEFYSKIDSTSQNNVVISKDGTVD